ncbi:hypothetical protein GCM10010492_57710 [Saccharothrix mutabilis subsp. mutabilis]|uniref:Uncharacterized protein n=1 Tax=Saccharothrix mutabilis subsp. mutabilis TaxID=66855 RepID=A0ABP3E5L3_9PSEU
MNRAKPAGSTRPQTPAASIVTAPSTTTDLTITPLGIVRSFPSPVTTRDRGAGVGRDSRRLWPAAHPTVHNGLEPAATERSSFARIGVPHLTDDAVSRKS